VITLEAYDQNTQSGYLRHLVVREGRNTGQALVQLVTAAHLEGYYYRPRIDLEMLAQHHDGIIGQLR